MRAEFLLTPSHSLFEKINFMITFLKKGPRATTRFASHPGLGLSSRQQPRLPQAYWPGTYKVRDGDTRRLFLLDGTCPPPDRWEFQQSYLSANGDLQASATPADDSGNPPLVWEDPWLALTRAVCSGQEQHGALATVTLPAPT